MRRRVCVAIETSGPRLGIVLSDLKAPRFSVLNQFFKETGPRQSELLLPNLEKQLRAARVTKKDIGLLAVDVGPGSFTGVRVGVAAARALAQGLNIPLVGVTSLEAMAWTAQSDHPKQAIVPCFPALAGEVYFAGFKPGFRVHHQPCWKKEEEFQAYVRTFPKSSPAVVVTDGPTPRAIAEIAWLRFRQKPRAFPYEKVVPVYLQPSWAERTKHAAAAR